MKRVSEQHVTGALPSRRGGLSRGPRSYAWVMHVVLIGVATAWLSGDAASAQNSCYDCHLAQQFEDEDQHLRDWRDSVHERAGVSCQACHGGDGTTLVQPQAHRGVLHSRSKKAPTHPRNLPATCGQCHGLMLDALQTSTHWELFEAGKRDAPTCYTCHGALATQSIGGGGLQAECQSCHGTDAQHPMVERLQRGAELTQRLRALTDSRSKAARLVLRVSDLALRHEAGDAYYEADQKRAEALEAGHAFQFDEALQSIAEAEQLFAQLIAQIDR